MLRGKIFFLGYNLKYPSFNKLYSKLLKNQWINYKEHMKQQEKQLRKIIQFAYKNVPYYHKIFKEKNIRPDDIKRLKDLNKLPIITKEIIRENFEEFKPVNLHKLNYMTLTTGGSTGTPFTYLITKKDYYLGTALMFRGWSYGGYKPGDGYIQMGGSSLVPNLRFKLKIFVHKIIKNVNFLSSFDMGEENLRKYIKTINKFKPKFIYCYASSAYLLANFIEKEGGLKHYPKAIFTTAEKLFPKMREKIIKNFNTEVFDTYSANDGGASANECEDHSGLLIDTERSIMEIVDERGQQIEEGKGRIIATSLHNYAMPFIRYEVGDIGYIIKGEKYCGRGYRKLKEVIGRQQEFVITPEGKCVHGEFFTHIFWEVKGVDQFQVIQKTKKDLIINIIPNKEFDEKKIEKIKKIIKKKSEKWNVKIKITNKLRTTKSGKYKFVMREK